MSMAGLRFLVAEDQDFQRRELVRTLESLGVTTVHQAADGTAALEILQDPQRPVDIVISDLDMAGMDGMELVRHLGETQASVSIILASALEKKLLASIGTMSEAYGITLLGLVEKPLTPRKLIPLILLHRTALSQAKRAQGVTFTAEAIADGLKRGEFEPWFQPKVDLATGKVRGVESLARWEHPRLGIALPSAFLQAFDDPALIRELTWTMLRKSSAHCRAWRASGCDVTVSVNLSVSTLANADIADRITELVHGQGLDARHMILEVTESEATREVGPVLENLARLRMKGFGLSIDDYGTGYSSMQQLSRIAFTELKIDRSFVTNAARLDSARVILEASIGMARKLDICCVAEGVESREDFDLLGKLQCDMAQGYFVARPMPVAELTPWLGKSLRTLP
ncbi:diguanylate phosphodiesterase [Betaproteobacteria bacterium GR16-43]|nr:diguanylate phosphodiesterase [Betaproteobacteria bacterium GR16-43]